MDKSGTIPPRKQEELKEMIYTITGFYVVILGIGMIFGSLNSAQWQVASVVTALYIFSLLLIYFLEVKNILNKIR